VVIWKQKLRRLDALLLFLCWIAALAWLIVSERYRFFLRPGFEYLLSAACAILIGFAAVTLFSSHFVHPPMPVRAARWTRLALILLPLVYLIAARETTLGSYAFKNRSANLGALANIRAKRTLEEIGKDRTLTPLEILQYFKEFEGEKIATEGMVYKGEDVPDQHFLVFRFLMICCAADALPAGTLVAFEDVQLFENDTWVKVEGILSLKVIGDLVFPHIQAEKVTPIDLPMSPYLIPSFS